MPFVLNHPPNRPIRNDNGFACTDKDRSETFATHMEKQFSLNENYDKSFHNQINSEVNAFLTNNVIDTPVESTNNEEV